jgi:prepilin-type processing-associated H-X9-DG protein
MRTAQTSNRNGFKLIELLLVVLGLGILASFVLPQLARRNARFSRIGCANNLKQVGLSFRTWALDNNDKYPAQVSVTNRGTMELVESGQAWVHFLVMSNELSTPKILMCPEEPDPTKRLADNFGAASWPGAPTLVPFTSDKSVGYFVGVDAMGRGSRTILSGDRNLSLDGFPANPGLLRITTISTVGWFRPRPRHNGGGNIAFADGSVDSLSSSALNSRFRQSGVATNRLAMP